MFTITQLVSLSLLTLGVTHAFPVTPNEALQIPDLAFEDMAAKPSGPHTFGQAKSSAEKRVGHFNGIVNYGWPSGDDIKGVNRSGGEQTVAVLWELIDGNDSERT
ncbi:hypothetical protein Clacol_004087 [Clathrus columnatus]|uniref:Uncharacterized protein n=1 Tax=Clathrus columnatus TaxID=1419009 RepID=A0AAV5A9M0_9AGAM|nr:hypothetical protein Clacol_004087 [Clathrus columnatus]